jgi:hypothetical protein
MSGGAGADGRAMLSVAHKLLLVVVAFAVAIGGHAFSVAHYLQQDRVVGASRATPGAPIDQLADRLEASSVPVVRQLGVDHRLFGKLDRRTTRMISARERVHPAIGWGAYHDAQRDYDVATADALEANLAVIEFAANALGTSPSAAELRQLRASQGMRSVAKAAHEKWIIQQAIGRRYAATHGLLIVPVGHGHHALVTTYDTFALPTTPAGRATWRGLAARS